MIKGLENVLDGSPIVLCHPYQQCEDCCANAPCQFGEISVNERSPFLSHYALKSHQKMPARYHRGAQVQSAVMGVAWIL